MVGPVDVGFVSARSPHRRLLVVRDHELQNAAQYSNIRTCAAAQSGNDRVRVTSTNVWFERPVRSRGEPGHCVRRAGSTASGPAYLPWRTGSYPQPVFRLFYSAGDPTWDPACRTPVGTVALTLRLSRDSVRMCRENPSHRKRAR